MRRTPGFLPASLGVVVLALGWASAARSDDAPPPIAPEPLYRKAALAAPGPHSAWYLDLNQLDLSATRYVRFDADDTEVAGILGTGSFPTLDIAPDGRELYVAESWLMGPRRTREDFVTVYDASTLEIDAVIELPGARRALMAPQNRTALTADGRLLVIFNFTPSTSLTIVDTAARRVVGTVPTPGCSLVYPTARRGVSMICGDGSLLTLHFDGAGRETARHRSEPFFDPDVDPIIENGVPIGDVWYFPSYGGDVYPVDLGAERPVMGTRWPLVDHAKRKANWLASLFTLGKAGPWRPGGYQLAAAHAASRRLFVLTHPVTWSDGEGDHVFPGPEVWVYDVDRRQRIDRIDLRGVGISVYVTPDPEPLLLVSGVDIRTEDFHLEVYDATSGKFLREMSEPGNTTLQFLNAATPAGRTQGAAGR